MSEAAYFAMLEQNIDKYEYWDGVAVALAGAQPSHVRIEGNLFGELFQQLRGKPCLPLGSNQAVRLAASRGYVFPDLTVVCGKPEYAIKRGIGCLLNPAVVVEVLSPSTAALDESDRLPAYKAIRTVREYLVVSGTRFKVKLFSRQTADETWQARLYELPADSVDLASCGCTLTLTEIYAGVDLAGAEEFLVD